MSTEVKEIVQSSGKRKESVARAVLKYPRRKQIKINKVPLEIYKPEISRMRIQEVLGIIQDEKLDKCSIEISVKGGGISGQTDAVRFAIARAINKFLGTKKVEEIYREYDDSLLSGDSRRVESKKFGGKKARARRQKSFR
jgi:small subunit ribosomal protein S9